MAEYTGLDKLVFDDAMAYTNDEVFAHWIVFDLLDSAREEYVKHPEKFSSIALRGPIASAYLFNYKLPQSVATYFRAEKYISR